MKIVLVLLTTLLIVAQQPLQQITISYPGRAGQVWPLYIAKEGGYYEKYGYDVKLVFGVHPAGIAMIVGGDAAMTPYALEQAMQASSKDGSLVAVGSPFKKSLFALMSTKNISSIRELKGKRIGISQLGDAPYNYTSGLLLKGGLSARDVQWLTVGTDVNGRAAALVSGRVDATMLTAPVYFRLEQEGYRNLGNISDYDDIYAPTVYLFKKSLIASNAKLAENLIKAHAEAIKRFYDDRAFAIKSYLTWDKQVPADIERAYDHYARTNTYERVPLISAPAVRYIIDQTADPQIAAQFKKFDFRTVIDNGIVERLVKEGFFQQLYGPAIKDELERKAKTAFR